MAWTASAPSSMECSSCCRRARSSPSLNGSDRVFWLSNANATTSLEDGLDIGASELERDIMPLTMPGSGPLLHSFVVIAAEGCVEAVVLSDLISLATTMVGGQPTVEAPTRFASSRMGASHGGNGGGGKLLRKRCSFFRVASSTPCISAASIQSWDDGGLGTLTLEGVRSAPPPDRPLGGTTANISLPAAGGSGTDTLLSGILLSCLVAPASCASVIRLILFSIEPNWVLMYLRRSTTSFTVAVLDPRKDRTVSMKVAKLMPPDSSSSSSKRKSAKSTNAYTSTSTLSSNFTADGLSRIATNSVLEIMWSPSVSRPPSLMMRSKPSFTVVIMIVSLSVAATALTTSHNTPINMFMTVRAAKSTKT
mmetsp:Transcript_40344/g.109041  ORF Transcript_40344/g.109041 Transcript_40344/m.109041 type:complete len:365 (-) Transcript_40344:965-2059(-)